MPKKYVASTGLALLIFIAGLFPQLVLNYYSNGLYPALSWLLRSISGIFPFAIGDILYLGLLVFAFVKVFRYFKNKKLRAKKSFITLAAGLLHYALILYISFKLLWGLNYSRPGIGRQLGIQNTKYDVKELTALGNFFIDRLNLLEPKIKSAQQQYPIDSLRSKAILAYQHMAGQNQLFRYTAPAFKPALNSWAISKLGIEGYYNPLSGEANLNRKLPGWVLPFVACHEIAHQLGIAREDEANLVGYLTAVHSKDLYFQYSANYNMLRYILYEIGYKSPEAYQLLYKKLNPQLIANFNAEREFWAKYNSEMSGYMTLAFDKFLKLNNQQQGIESYQHIVIWLWNYHRPEIQVR